MNHLNLTDMWRSVGPYRNGPSCHPNPHSSTLSYTILHLSHHYSWTLISRKTLLTATLPYIYIYLQTQKQNHNVHRYLRFFPFKHT